MIPTSTAARRVIPAEVPDLQSAKACAPQYTPIIGDACATPNVCEESISASAITSVSAALLTPSIPGSAASNVSGAPAKKRKRATAVPTKKVVAEPNVEENDSTTKTNIANSSSATYPTSTYPTSTYPGASNQTVLLPARIQQQSEAPCGSATATETIQEDPEFYRELDKLQDFGINMADINKFKSAGFCTVLSIIQATKKELCQIKGISEAKADKAIEAAGKLETATSFVTGTQLLQRRAQVVKLTTGSKQLDLILNGGIESMGLTEVFGEARTGKSQLCHTLCVTAQLPRQIGGGNGKVCVIDTEGSFRPEKIGQIAARFGLTCEAVLDNILYTRAFTHEHLNQLISLAAVKMIEERFSLLIVDSIMALFRVDFSGRGELAERQQLLGRLLSKLTKLAEQFNIAVFMTNHVMADPAGGLTFVANVSKPIGGHVLGHASTTRLSVRKGRGAQRICKVYDSPYLPEAEAVFELSDGGVIDPTD